MSFAPLPPLEAPRARFYNAARAQPLLGAFERGILAQVQRHLRRRGRPPLVVDPALCHASRAYTEGMRRLGRRPPGSFVDFLLQAVGVTEPHPLVFHASIPNGQVAAFPRRFEQHLLRLTSGSPTEVGIAAARESDRVLLTLLVLSRAAKLGTVARRAPVGAILPIHGQLTAGYRTPLLMITTPKGRFRQRRMRVQSGKFAERISLDDGPGRYTVEILAQGPLGPTVASLFPVFAGVPLPTHFRMSEPRVTTPSSPREAEQILLALVNRERLHRGLKPVRHSEQLAAVARSHSVDMVRRGFVGHRSPTTGTLVDRLERAGVLAAVSLENIARNETLGGAHAGLMGSPGHRRNILDPRVEQVGVGVVYTRSSEQRQIFITQNFIKPIEVIDPLSARRELWSEVQRRRKAAGLPRLMRDEALEAVAARAARSILERGSLDADHSRRWVASELRKSRYRFRALAASFFVERGLREALDASAWMRTGSWRVGLGVAQRPRSTFGSYALCLVLLMARGGDS